jgi:cytoskeletal protein RodZ
VVDGIGATLRSARLTRGESLAQSSLAVGIGPLFLAALEDEQYDTLPATANRQDMLARYARHLGLDPALVTEPEPVVEDDSDAITQEIPIVRAPVPRDSTLAWVGGGAAIGLVGLIALGGGLGGGAPTSQTATQPRATTATATPPRSATGTPTRPAPTNSTTSTAPTPLRPTPPVTAAINLTLTAKAGKTVWVEVRRGDANGEQVFAGIVGGTVRQAIKSAKPLWLGVAWAPNLAVTLNGEVIDAEGGTESYTVTPRGLTRLGSSGAATP